VGQGIVVNALGQFRWDPSTLRASAYDYWVLQRFGTFALLGGLPYIPPFSETNPVITVAWGNLWFLPLVDPTRADTDANFANHFSNNTFIRLSPRIFGVAGPTYKFRKGQNFVNTDGSVN
jgi:hypothetical protein